MSLSTSIPPPKWVVEMNTPLAKRPGKTSFRNPPGFTTKASGKQQETRSAPDRKPVETDTLKLKKAWEVALAPSKQIPMNAIMMYMSGNSLQIFSIMMVFMLFKGPIQGLIATNAQFVKFETESNRTKIWGCKAVYVLMQLVLLGMGVWKVNAMGLLPTTRSDWLAWESERISLERAFFAFG
ncbi:hypothetical protein EYB25_008422 [Talaromyces marneffei]|uniref:ER membrane protein complex subunit 4 n=1 Tax=Talaromyces marneffei (strain ATCC 18224 / CBS 334.59 / QM 7333) TaxID=441960 RepID=B6QP84_TALMQ|nr:uncharacterized protein EYB26_003483 [Talaromyces marneffei]EEA20945.1 ER membrane DUF1077 domain protein, putative [Talaromyces marneffei ATCC 18224]KAE8549897.1 hypothetical protein EYB25_008422 [Talaromyces marneffei]QGA15822.1 hypothetical protein EYB26_003483 [Talaromyces marneffei]